MEKAFFELENISKYFSKVIANKDVSFSIKKGEVVALLGENGAGKSTIMKILYGLYRADEGKIYKNGEEVKIHTPKDAMALGISMIQQHFSLVAAHSVTENIILGNVKGRIDKKKCAQDVKELSEEYHFDVDPNAIIRDLPVGVQQRVEILKALYQKAELLIMDEPTAVLTPQETEHLMDFVREFTNKGNSVIFITHKLKEVMSVADRIIVMGNGEIRGNLLTKDTNEKELSKLMIGKDIVTITGSDIKPPSHDHKALELKDITYEDKTGLDALNKLNFTLYAGEILGVAGVSGNGQQELCEVICGALTPKTGTILLNDQDITKESINSRIDLGIGYVPADRHHEGMVLNMSLSENLFLKNSFNKEWLNHGLINKKKLVTYTEKAIKDYEIKTAGPDALAKDLSGGNQQKVVLAREVDMGKEVIIFDQPTRGLDLGAIHHVHQTILEQKDAGKGVLLISTELSEIFALSDRIIVLYRGEIQGIFNRGELNSEKIGLLMAGFSSEKEMVQ